MNKPRVAVSACLLGHRLRYDGGSRPHTWIRDILPRYVQVLPFCPETGAGLETPRPAVQLVQLEDGSVRALGVDNPALDVTGVLQEWSDQQKRQVQALDALVLKSRSPSCGWGTTPLFDGIGTLLKTDFDGIFVALVKTSFPDLVLCDDVSLEQKQGQQVFLEKLHMLVESRLTADSTQDYLGET